MSGVTRELQVEVEEPLLRADLRILPPSVPPPPSGAGAGGGGGSTGQPAGAADRLGGQSGPGGDGCPG